MAKGKKKTLQIETHKDNVEREAKENKQNTRKTCEEQSTLHSCVKPAQHRNSPLFPVHEENGSASQATDSSKHGEVELSSKEEQSGARTSSFSSKKTEAFHKETAPPGVSLPKKSETQVGVKVNKSTQKKTGNKNGPVSRKVTDYYPIRRSSRKSKAELKEKLGALEETHTRCVQPSRRSFSYSPKTCVSGELCEEQHHIDDLITNNVEDGLKVKYTEGKGRGVFADRAFRKGQFVVEYHGDLLQISDAREREAQYAQDPTKGCYMYYFHHLNSTYCVDATKETGRLGRLINHSKNGNCQTRLHDLRGVPHLILVASRDIDAEEELLYDYGDRSKDAIAAHPWLKH